MHLTRATVEMLLHSESPHVRVRGVERSFTLICTVEEGASCRFGTGEWNDGVLHPLLPAIVAELGWKEIEHSARREVVIHCSAPENAGTHAVCEIDRGTGFEPLLVMPAEVPEIA